MTCSLNVFDTSGICPPPLMVHSSTAPPGGLFVFGDEPDTPWPVIAVDLIDAGDDRSVRAAHELFERSRP